MGRLLAHRLRVYRLEAALGEPLDLGDVSQGHRRIVPLTGGTFTDPELNGKLLWGVSADSQIFLPDGTVLGDIRYALQTDDGDFLLRAIARRAPRRRKRFSHVSAAATTSTRANTPSGPPPKSRPRPATSIG